MGNLIDKLYELHLKEYDFPFGVPNKKNLDEECEAYCFLCEHLSGENKKIFLRYAELLGGRKNRETKYAYESGFKKAVSIIIEGLEE